MSNLFKPEVSLVTPTTPSFRGGGLFGKSIGGRGVVTADAGRNDVISGLSGAGESAANTFGDLYETVKPGFNDLLNARLNSFNDSARSAIGDLAQNLSARRILGSSFGQDTLNRGRAEFGRLRDNIVADNFLKSLEAQRILTTDKFNALVKSFQPKLDELNLEANLAANLGMAGSKAIADAAQFNAKNQNAANAAGTTGMWSAIGTGLGYLLPSNPFKSMFGGGGGGGGFSFDGASVDPSSVFLV